MASALGGYWELPPGGVGAQQAQAARALNEANNSDMSGSEAGSMSVSDLTSLQGEGGNAPGRLGEPNPIVQQQMAGASEVSRIAGMSDAEVMAHPSLTPAAKSEIMATRARTAGYNSAARGLYADISSDLGGLAQGAMGMFMFSQLLGQQQKAQADAQATAVASTKAMNQSSAEMMGALKPLHFGVLPHNKDLIDPFA